MTTEDEALGASAFAATLNGDNPQAMLRDLKLFRKIVRRERRFALSSKDFLQSDDEHSEDDDDDDDDLEGCQPPPNKKFKKSEGWKADTEAYHVPFVGTAVAAGEAAQVVQGEWPTGLLKAYLTKSPLATELINPDMIPPDGKIHKGLVRKKKGSLSRAIFKSYLLALSELVTASIPTKGTPTDPHLRDKTKSMEQPFLPVLLKMVTTVVFTLLNDETDKGRGKPGVFGGCGSWAAPALSLLHNISIISPTNARMVARYLEEKLADGVLPALLRPTHATSKIVDEDDTNPKIKSKNCRAVSIRLATALLKAGDAAVNSYICTAGNRERKVIPGILFRALREGLAHLGSTKVVHVLLYKDEDHLSSVAAMLKAIRLHLLKPYTASNQRLYGELLSKDALENLCNLVGLAPPLMSGASFENILAGTDEYEELKAVELAGVEARRLVFLLLSDTSSSPFLPRLGKDAQQHKIYEQDVVRVMARLLEIPRGGIIIRRFLVYCLNETPTFLPALFAILPYPDPQKIFGFVASTSFVATLQRKGPNPLSCVPRVEQPTNIDEALLSVLPVKFQRNQFGRALQNSNDLIVYEALKLVKLSLKRFESLHSGLSQVKLWDKMRLGELTVAFSKCVPDLQLILSLRSKFNSQSREKSHILINDLIHQILEVYSHVLPSTLNETKFDWMKLLPPTSQFLKTSPMVQTSIIRTLLLVTSNHEVASSHNPAQLQVLFGILLKTKHETVHGMCREIAHKLLMGTLQRTMGGDNIATMSQELSCWIDTLSLGDVDSFCKIVKEVASNPLEVMVNLEPTIAERVIAGKAEFTVLLIVALNSADESIAPYVSQVAARCLLRQRNPIPLATVIDSFSQSGSFASVSHGTALIEYSKSLSRFHDADGCGRLQKLHQMVDVCFSSSNSWSLAHDLASNRLPGGSIASLQSPFNFEDALSLTRFLLHMYCLDSKNEMPLSLLSRIVPALILHDADHEETSLILKDIFGLQRQIQSQRLNALVQLILSCPSWAKQDTIKRKREGNPISVHETCSHDESLLLDYSGRAHLLGRFLSEDALSSEGIVKTIIGLLRDIGENDKQLCECANWLMLRFAPSAIDRIKADSIHRNDVLREFVRCWWKLSVPPVSIAVSGKLRIQVVSRMGSLISQILNNDDFQSVITEACIGEYDARQSVDLCINHAINEKAESHRDDSGSLSLLCSCLNRHPLRYVPVFLSILDQRQRELGESLESGLFDPAILVALRHREPQEGLDGLYVNLAGKLVGRTANVLPSTEETNESSGVLELLEVTLAAMERLPLMGFDPGIGKGVSWALDALAGQHLRKSSLMPLIRMGMHLVKSSDFSEQGDKRAVSAGLASKLFVLLCDLLPRSYRNRSRDADCSLCPDAVIVWLQLLVEKASEYELEFTNRALIQSLCRCCLKFGVSLPIEGFPSVPALSLRLVRTILEQSFDTASPFCQMKGTYVVPSPADVFDLVTSHSKFSSVLIHDDKQRGTNGWGSTKIEVFHLLRVCVNLSSSAVIVRDSFWQNVNIAFDAGLGEVDTAIRMFLQVCCTSETKGIQVPVLDQWRWAGCVERESFSGARWEWLITALDPHRIRSTVSNFPLFDTIKLNLGHDKDIDKSQRDGRSSPIDNSCEAWQASFETDWVRSLDRKDTRRPPVDEARPRHIQGHNTHRDNRYSPGFLLPMILAAVESLVLDSYDDDGLDDDTAISQFDKLFVPTVHRLCEKGVISFLLASLASQCDEVRKYAIAILGLFKFALDSEEARKRASWRERPQLAMMLNAVQRAFVLKRAGQGGRSIPTLSPLVSTFLARASVSIAKPDDALFSALNHFFLKSDQEHGAFQDMNRLPGFISLFCSASEDMSLRRKERLWALTSLRDGFATAACYRLVSACHAPQLILTSFENVRLGNASDDMKGQEFTLLLDVLVKLVRNGGSSSVRHLVKLVGLLSWMRSIGTEEALPTSSAKRAFCDLVSVAVKAVSVDEQLRIDVFPQEVAIMSQSVLDIFKVATSESKAEVDSPLMHSFCLAMQVLSDAFLTDHSAEKVFLSGISIASGIHFLETVPDKNYHLAANAMSTLPINLERCTVSEAEAFCSLLLRRTGPDTSSDTVERVLKLTALIGQRFGGSLEPGASTLNILLRFRAQGMKSREAYSLWLKCADLFSSRGLETDAELARQFLQNDGDLKR